MIVLSASGLTKTYGQDVILEDVSFHVNAGERIGIIGRNGAGKTTLINMLTGELAIDKGEFFVAGDKEIGYLKQRDNFQSDKSIIEEVSGIFSHLSEMEREMEELNEKIASSCEEDQKKLWERLTELQNRFEREGGYTYKSEISGVLTAMGFGESTFGMDTGSLSGGERTRLALACLLLKKPDILFLDEPTNHLDIGSLKWLEQYLKSYSGTMILVSHDRYFLDSIVTHIFEIENHGLKMYKGNYTEFAEKKKALLEADLRAYSKQQKEIRRQEDLIRGYKERGTEKLAKRAKSREKRLSHVERLDKPMSSERSMKINFHEKYQSGHDVLFCENISFGYEKGSSSHKLFRDISLDIKRGEKICIIGDNGTGKTTLLKVIMGDLNPDSGFVKMGHNIEMAYYDQGQLMLNEALTVMDEVHNEFRLYTDGGIRNILGRFLFKGDDVFKKVGDLSGGEKARLALLKLMMSGANLLVLDEPTNHLDIESKEAFEDALLDYPGTVLTVSHDRYFLNKIPSRILELSEGGLTEFLGKYDYYLEKKRSMESGKEHMKALGEGRDYVGTGYTLSDPLSKDQSTVKEEREEKKKREAAERKRAREIQSLMDRIDELEGLIENAEAEMCKPEVLSDHERLSVLAREVKDWKADLDQAYNRWMDMAEDENYE